VGLNNERDWAVVHQFDVHVSRKAAASHSDAVGGDAVGNALVEGLGQGGILARSKLGRLPLRMEPASVN